MEDILASAGIARRTFYKYFKSKEEVLEGIYELATGELISVIQTAASEANDPLDALRRGLDAYLDYHVERAGLIRILVEEAMRSESPLAAHRSKFRDDLVSLMDAAVRASSGTRNDAMFYLALISAVEGISLELLAANAGTREVKRAKKVLRSILDRTLAD